MCWWTYLREEDVDRPRLAWRARVVVIPRNMAGVSCVSSAGKKQRSKRRRRPTISTSWMADRTLLTFHAVIHQGSPLHEQQLLSKNKNWKLIVEICRRNFAKHMVAKPLSKQKGSWWKNLKSWLEKGWEAAALSKWARWASAMSIWTT